jgi:hypothetical protein
MAHGYRQLAPGLRLNFELFSTLASQLVVFGAAIILADRPVSLDPTATLKAVKSGVKRALLHLQRFTGYLLKAFGNCPSVERFQRQAFKMRRSSVP